MLHRGGQSLMPKEIRTPLFDYAKKQGLYHFDIDKPDDDDIIFKPKFKGTWIQELDHFKANPFNFNLEREFTRMQFEEWMNLGYDISKFFGKMPPDETTPTIQKMAGMIPFDKNEITQIQITEQKPGQYIPYHMDVLTSSGIEAKKVIKNGYRVIVFLTDWMPGEFMLWGTTTIQKWKAGWILAWPALKYPHGTSNVSHHVGYRVRCSGLATEDTYEWVNSNKIIEV